MYSLTYKVTTSTCDSEGKLKLYSALQMMQDCSEMWIDSEPEVRDYFLQQNMAQLLATRQVEIIRVPDYKEELTVTTSVYGMKPMFGFRNTFIYDAQGNPCYKTWSMGAFVDKVAGKLKQTIEEIVNNVHGLPIIFPLHPRTAKIFKELGIEADNLHIVEPMGYLEFNYMVKYCKAVVTDSGSITEETTVMGVPCITLRDNTERPETCTVGTNELIGTNPKAIKPALDILFAGSWKKGGIPELWDGHAAERIINYFLRERQ